MPHLSDPVDICRLRKDDFDERSVEKLCNISMVHWNSFIPSSSFVAIRVDDSGGHHAARFGNQLFTAAISVIRALSSKHTFTGSSIWQTIAETSMCSLQSRCGPNGDGTLCWLQWRATLVWQEWYLQRGQGVSSPLAGAEKNDNVWWRISPKFGRVGTWWFEVSGGIATFLLYSHPSVGSTTHLAGAGRLRSTLSGLWNGGHFRATHGTHLQPTLCILQMGPGALPADGDRSWQDMDCDRTQTASSPHGEATAKGTWCWSLSRDGSIGERRMAGRFCVHALGIILGHCA